MAINFEPTIQTQTVASIFTKHIAKVIPLAFDESMSYYECICAFRDYLNTVIIPNVNNVNDAVAELQSLYLDLQDAVNTEIERFETDITTDFNNLHDFVDNYFENNFPALVSSTLDEMAEDGTLENLLNDAAHLTKSYSTYNDMISDSSTFTNGLRLKTFGYYNINDGGSAEYYVTDSVISNAYQIELSNDLYLTLIIKEKLNVKQIGAYGDNSHDDTQTLQSAFNLASNYIIEIPTGNYKIDDSLTLNGNNILIDGEHANIIYTGDDYAIKSTKLLSTTFKINNITAANGGCIELGVTSSANQFTYDNFYFNSFSALTNCVYAHCTGGGWINELRWFNGRLESGENGFYIEHNFTGQWADNAINGWHFNNIGVEGVTNGFYLNAISGNIWQFDFNGLRNAESFTKLLKTSGWVQRLGFYGANMILDSWLDLSNHTNSVNIFGNVKINGVLHKFGYIDNGILTSYDNMFTELQSGQQLSSNTDLNNIIVPGTYTSNNNATTQSITNKPSEVTSGSFKLTVMETTNAINSLTPQYAYLVQTIYSGDRIFVRKCDINGGTKSFSSWNELQKKINPTILNGGTQLSGSTNLNTITIPGTYTSNNNATTQSITNKPSEITGGAFKLVVMETTNSIITSTSTWAYLIQIIYATGNIKNIYFRSVTIENGTVIAGTWKAVTSS